MCGFRSRWIQFLRRCVPLLAVVTALPLSAGETGLTLAREENWLILLGKHLPEGRIRINYLEAYCRPGSTGADWHDTVIGHTTSLISLSPDKKSMHLRCAVSDGIQVDHRITAGADEVTFVLTAHNPTSSASDAHWAQPCVRLGAFTGFPDTGPLPNDYLAKCFIFPAGRLTLLSGLTPWATEARYTPGQVWAGPGVPRTDVNPRPLSPLRVRNGLIGCFSGDDSTIFAVAFDPWQELFQGVARCLHADFRIGGLEPGETKQIRGKIYLVPNDVPALLARYAADFPEHPEAGKTAIPVK